ncbi:hypothetical protein [Streptomyces albogriseolus]|uniref:hypothetical protein n=1 Tax=Streptomyces albogriseolus TaxID=1887 RepID=UPI0034601BA8
MPCACRPWPIDLTCCAVWPTEESPPEDQERAQRALAIASERLRTLTAGRFGLCEEVIRPCNAPDSPCEPPAPWAARGLYGHGGGGILDPYAWRGGIRNQACGCVGDCSCGPVSKVVLPGPAAEIVQVLLDGQTVPPTAYTLTPDGWLVRTDGGRWPDCQDMTKPATEPGTFAVRYLRGRDPGDSYDAIRAVTTLACELFRSLCGQKCRIQGRVRSINREGVSYDMLDEWPRRGTGLDEVDDWLSLVNPTGRTQKPAVFTPDLPVHHFYGRRDC